jgi:hypothetical protein
MSMDLQSRYTADVDSDQIIAVLRALMREGVRYKIVGAVALNLIGLPRATQDLDIFVAADEANVERLRAALRSVFDDPEIDGISASDLAGDYPAIQYIPPTGTFHIDILNRLGQAFAYEDIEVEERPFEDLRIPVATPAMLYRMKKGTVRPQDRAHADRVGCRQALPAEAHRGRVWEPIEGFHHDYLRRHFKLEG